VLAPLDAWNVPGEQLAHVVWPGESVNVPGSQDWHVLAPLDAWKVPGEQLAHVVWPGESVNVPGSQGCAVAGVAIAPVRVKTTSAGSARSGDGRAIDFPSSVREALATRWTTRRDAGPAKRGRGPPPDSSHAEARS